MDKRRSALLGSSAINASPDEHKYRNARRFMRVDDAAEYCGLSKSTFDKLRVRGGGPVFIKRGRAVLYDVLDLDAWLAKGRRASTPDSVGALRCSELQQASSERDI
jgi:predicted DNA-binding transcriptional regulator AlpA